MTSGDCRAGVRHAAWVLCEPGHFVQQVELLLLLSTDMRKLPMTALSCLQLYNCHQEAARLCWHSCC